MTYAPRFSLLCPSRHRPTQARELLESIRASAAGDIELILRLDEDDPTLNQYYDQVSGSDVRFVVGPRVVLSQCWNDAADEARADLLMQLGDDIRFRSVDWDDLIAAEFDKYDDRILLVHGRDGIQDDKVATHGVIHRRWVETLGYFVPPIFASDYNDMWLTEVADAIGRRRYLPDVYTEHLHPVAGKGEWDITHQERMERHRAENCDALWANTADRRALDIGKLEHAMTTVEAS